MTPSTRTPLRRLVAVAALALTTAVALGACSSSDDSSSGSSDTGSRSTTATSQDDGSGSSTTTTGSSAASLPKDPCALLPADQVTTLLGSAATGTPGASATDPSGPQFTSCQWGELTTDAGQVSVAVSVPSGDGGIDYLATLAGATGIATTPSSVGTDGKVVDAFIRPGGGGVGTTVWFTKDGKTVLVSRSGGTVDVATLEAAASAVDQNL